MEKKRSDYGKLWDLKNIGSKVYMILRISLRIEPKKVEKYFLDVKSLLKYLQTRDEI